MQRILGKTMRQGAPILGQLKMFPEKVVEGLVNSLWKYSGNMVQPCQKQEVVIAGFLNAPLNQREHAFRGQFPEGEVENYQFYGNGKI